MDDKEELSWEKFGSHFYPGIASGSTSDCQYGCGCWMGGFRSGGPEDVDPFGPCPKNPITDLKNGEKIMDDNEDMATACEICGLPTGSEECRNAHETFPGNILGPNGDICPGCQHSITSQEHINAHKSYVPAALIEGITSEEVLDAPVGHSWSKDIHITEPMIKDRDCYLRSDIEVQQEKEKELKIIKDLIIQYGVDVSNADNSKNYKDFFVSKSEQELEKIMKEIELFGKK